MPGPLPDVTVVLPTRNRRPLVARALATVLGQRDVDLEAIVVDDASTDGTTEALRAIDDLRVRPIRLTARSGVAAARNRAIGEARGSWVAFLDDDDVWAPTKLRDQLAAATASDNVSLVCTASLVLDDRGRATELRDAPDPSELGQALFERNLIGGPSTVMAPTDVLRELGGFDERLSVLADWDLWVRLLEVGRAAVCPEPLAGYTVHAGGMHRAGVGAIPSELRYLRRKHGRAFGGPAFSRWLVGGLRREGRSRDAAREYFWLGVREHSRRDLLRAAAMLLGGRAMPPGGRGKSDLEPPPPPEPAWLAALRGQLVADRG